MDLLVWSLVFLAAGAVLATLEFFLPTGGVLGVGAFLLLIAAIWLAFLNGAWSGLAMLVAAIVGVPALLSVAVRVFPDLPWVRRLVLDVPANDEVLPDSPLRRSLRDLVGRTGVARSLMTPNGAVEVDDQTIDAVSDAGAIEPGQTVQVVEVHGMRVTVRPYTPPPARILPTADDPLSQPIDSIVADPFADPGT